MALLSLVPALWNGFPLIFSDTNGYVAGWRGAYPITPPYYAFAVWITSRPVSLFFTLTVQTVVVCHILYLFIRGVGRLHDPLLAGASGVAVLGLTQLPWVASYIMPDVFAGVGLACLALLFLAPDALSRVERHYVLAAAVFSTIVSTANVLILASLCTALLIAECALASRRRAVVLRGLAYLAVMLVLALLPNRLAFDRWTIHPPSGVMMFNLLVDSGIAQDVLRQHCPELSRKICRLLPELERIDEREEFLWSGLAHEHQGFSDPDGEFRRVSRLIATERPLEVASLVARQTIEQFATISLADEATYSLGSYANGSLVEEQILKHLPREHSLFASALQQKGAIVPYYPETYYIITTYAGYLLLLGLLPLALRERDRVAVTLVVATLAFIALGLVVQGGLVSPQPRYHAKISWAAWLAIVAASHRLFLAARGDGPVRRGERATAAPDS